MKGHSILGFGFILIYTLYVVLMYYGWFSHVVRRYLIRTQINGLLLVLWQ